MIKIEGDKITLRDWQLADLPEYKKWNTGQHPWMDFNAPYFDDAFTKKELFDRLKMMAERIENNSFPKLRTRLAIANKSTNEFIGSVSWYWTSKETNWKSIGILVYNHEHWHKGIGTEALSLWTDYLFTNDKSIVRLDFRTWSGNERMIGVGKKLGFKTEAVFRKARIVNGEYFDSVAMGILREEWEGQT